MTIDVPLVQGRDLTLTGTFRCANSYPLALGLIAAGGVEVDSIITHRFDIQHTEDALTVGRRDRTRSRPSSSPAPPMTTRAPTP